MSNRNRAGKLTAALALVVAGLVAGFAIATAPPAAGTMPQEASPAVLSNADMPAMVPQGQFVTVAEEMGPKVVFIEAERPRERPSGQRFQRFFDEFFGQDPRGQQEEEDGEAPFDDLARSQGSGVIVSPDGLILTNAHVVASVNMRTAEEERATSVRVVMQNEDTYDAEIVGVDLGTDIALLKIDGANLPYARMGDSDEIRVGEWVMAVGAPFGLQNTVSAGIVSALGRGSLGGMQNTYQDFIQTDAAINPGNSGGPLVNLHGEIVGINTAIATNGVQPAFAGVGFAVPANLARAIMEELRDNGRVVRGYLGVTVQPLGRETREGLGLDPRLRGAVVATVTQDGPAEEAGLRPSDIVVGMNGEALRSQQDFLQRIAFRKPGDTVHLQVLRDGDEIEISVTLTERPDEASIIAGQANLGLPDQPDEREERTEASSIRSLGLRVTDLSGRLREQLELPGDMDGVVVANVLPNSPAARVGISEGDLIMRVRQDPVSSVEDFMAAMEGFQPGDAVALFVYNRQTATSAFVTLRIPRE